MAKYSSQELDAIYHALANSSRRRMLTRLAADGPLSVLQLAEPFEMSLAAVSKHIKVLEKAGLIRKEKKSTTHLCHFNPEPVETAAALVQFLKKSAPEPTPAADGTHPSSKAA